MINLGKVKWITLGASLLAGILISATWLGALGQASATSPPAAATPAAGASGSGYVVLAWNDLGMHCYNHDFQDLAVLPPYNTLWAQVIRVGSPPQIVTTGITITYAFTDNTYSVGKTNFWTYANRLFGANLAPNVGLAGKGLAGTLDVRGDHFVAEGIPLTEYSDSAPTIRNPFQLATVTVRDSGSGTVLAQSLTVAPVSTEMRCDNCHKDGGVEGVSTGRVETNILTLHDSENMDEYPAGHNTGSLMSRRPVLCAECHASNALNAPGAAGLPSLSNAMHEKHRFVDGVYPGVLGCYSCHPGPQTRCLRDVMSQRFGLDCRSCHGSVQAVSQNPSPWLKEPRCDNATCHGNTFQQDQALYRMSKGHGGVYCEGCHDSTHAIAPSREPNDGLKFVALQGRPTALDTCTVCHASPPTGPGPHNIAASRALIQTLPSAR